MPKILPPLQVESAEWLSARRSRITATDAGKLYDGMTAEQLVRHKLESQPITNNKYLNHGKEREPFIASEFEFLFGLIPTDSIYLSDEDERFAASPDAVSEGLMLLGEYKTVKVERSWAARLDAIPKNYYGQMMWQMFVTGARKVIFGWEPHDNFDPMPVQWLEVDYDEGLVRELIVPKALKALELLAAEPLVVEDIEALMIELAEKNAALEKAQSEVNDVRDKISEALELNALDSYGSRLGSISYKIPAASKRFDSKLFQKENPELYTKYQVQQAAPQSPVLRITMKKEEENE